MGRLPCISTVHTRCGWSRRAVPPVGCTRSLLIGPATLFGPRLRSTGFSPEKTFPEKKICMGKQKNRLTARKGLSVLARTPTVCPSAEHVVAVADCSLAPPAAPATPFQGTCFCSSRVLGYSKRGLPGYLRALSRALAFTKKAL